MNFLASQIAAIAMQKGSALQRSSHSLLVCILLRHALPQQRPQQAGNTGILSRRLDTSPLRDLFFESHSDVA